MKIKKLTPNQILQHRIEALEARLEAANDGVETLVALLWPRLQGRVEDQINEAIDSLSVDIR